MSLIVKRPPYPGGSATQRFNNTVYLHVARVCAQILGRSDDVRSIFVRRSLAAGEVFPPFSDIDLSIILNSPLTGDGESLRLARLFDTFRRLRMAMPILGEIEVLTAEEFAWWGRVEPYRHSLSARVGILVYGEPLEVEDCPVSRHAAVRRFIFWFEHFISQAIRTSNKRNLRKFALEFWNARACATGRIELPFISRRESESDWRAASGDDAFPNDLGRTVLASAGACFDQAKKLHEEVMAPLLPLSSPLVYEERLWPVGDRQCFIVLPHCGCELPPEAARKDSMICTPEVLDLYIHFCNPFKYWTLPDELRDLGMVEPSLESYTEGCRYSLEPHRSREPGFSCRDVKVLARYWTMNQVAAQLKAGSHPHPPGLAELQLRRDSEISPQAYFREAYEETYALGTEARVWLDEMNPTKFEAS